MEAADDLFGAMPGAEAQVLRPEVPSLGAGGRPGALDEGAIKNTLRDTFCAGKVMVLRPKTYPIQLFGYRKVKLL
jgi:hypothetical protein